MNYNLNFQNKSVLVTGAASGIGLETVKAFLQCGAAQIQADHFTANPASGAVMRKAGMEYCQMLPGKYEKNGVVHNAHWYRITREQWLRIHPGFSLYNHS